MDYLGEETTPFYPQITINHTQIKTGHIQITISHIQIKTFMSIDKPILKNRNNSQVLQSEER